MSSQEQPEVFAIGHRAEKIPPDWVKHLREPDGAYSAMLRDRAVEISPGVHVTSIYTGDFLFPDGTWNYATLIAVWAGSSCP